MNILKPQKIQVEKLQKIDDLDYELRDNDEELEYRILENIKLNNEEMYDAKIGKSKFQNVEILNGKLENNTFIDVIFDNCNFSNSSCITASTPGFCKPIAFNIPLGPSAILGKGFP